LPTLPRHARRFAYRLPATPPLLRFLAINAFFHRLMAMLSFCRHFIRPTPRRCSFFFFADAATIYCLPLLMLIPCHSYFDAFT